MIGDIDPRQVALDCDASMSDTESVAKVVHWLSTLDARHALWLAWAVNLGAQRIERVEGAQ